MASSQIFIVRDDNDGVDLALCCQQWTYDLKDVYYGFERRILFPGFSANESSPMGSFTVRFEGVAVAFIGNSPGKNQYQTFNITIDNNKTYNSSTDDTNPQHYLQWYQSPLLPSGQHTINVGNMNGLALDYMYITPGPDTPLTGQTLIVDDFYTGIKYQGHWESGTNQTFNGLPGFLNGNMFQNSTHHTTTVGDFFTFSYTGTNSSVWGVYPWGQVGSLSVSYTIDGGSSFSNTFTSSGATNFNEQPHFKLVDTGPLAAGNHTINVTLTGSIGQTLFVDYILYTPSFATLAQMPNLTSSSSSGPGTSTTATVGATGTSTDNPTPSGGKSIAGPVAGGVVGGLAALAIIAVLLWWFRFRRRGDTTAYSAAPQSDMASSRPPLRLPSDATQSMHETYIVEPFSATSSFAPRPITKTSAGFTHSPNPSSSFDSNAFSRGPPSSVGGSTTTATMSTASRQADNVRRMQNLQSMVDRGGTAGVEDVDDLRRRINDLEEENRQLATMTAPPAYDTQ